MEIEKESKNIKNVKKRNKQSNRINFYINKKQTLEDVNLLSSKFNESRNSIINQSLEIGLPILKKRYGVMTGSDEQKLINLQEEIIRSQQVAIEALQSEIKELKDDKQKYYQSLRDELTHINATVSIQEYINSSTYEHLKFFLNIFIATQGAGKMSEELSRSYDNRIAEQFLEKKIKALSNFLFKNDNVYLGDKEADEKLKRENEIKYKKNKALYDEIVNKKL